MIHPRACLGVRVHPPHTFSLLLLKGLSRMKMGPNSMQAPKFQPSEICLWLRPWKQPTPRQHSNTRNHRMISIVIATKQMIEHRHYRSLLVPQIAMNTDYNYLSSRIQTL